MRLTTWIGLEMKAFSIWWYLYQWDYCAKYGFLWGARTANVPRYPQMTLTPPSLTKGPSLDSNRAFGAGFQRQSKRCLLEWNACCLSFDMIGGNLTPGSFEQLLLPVIKAMKGFIHPLVQINLLTLFSFQTCIDFISYVNTKWEIMNNRLVTLVYDN